MGLDIRSHDVADANGRRLTVFVPSGQVNDHSGVATLLDRLPAANWTITVMTQAAFEML